LANVKRHNIAVDAASQFQRQEALDDSANNVVADGDDDDDDDADDDDDDVVVVVVLCVECGVIGPLPGPGGAQSIGTVACSTPSGAAHSGKTLARRPSCSTPIPTKSSPISSPY
jgi:hypothetical protein